MRSISILGCGWLGFPLALRCVQKKFLVKGSTTRSGKLKDLESSGIVAHMLDYSPQCVNVSQDFFDTETLFLNIPFRRDLKNPQFYFDQIKAVLGDARKGKVHQVLFAGSTSIYSDKHETAREDDALAPENKRSRVLGDVEKFLLGQYPNTTILRFGGLVGTTRKIGQFLSGRKNLPDPDKPVNLIHLEDCLAIILKLFDQPAPGEIFNVVCDGHPSRRELYVRHARQSAVEPPEFSSVKTSPVYKTVSNEKIKKVLGYSFRYPDPLEFPCES